MSGKSFAIKAILLLAFLMNSIAGTAQPEDDRSTSIWENLDTLRIATVDNGKLRFTPFIAPSFSPELGFTFSAGGLMTFKLQKDNPVLERSSMPFSVGYSTNKSLIVSARPTLYGKNDRFRVIGEIWYKNLPDHYWGVGYDNGRNQVKSDSTTLYQRKWWRFYNKVVIKLRDHLYLGPTIDFSKTTAGDLNPVMKLDEAILMTDSIIRNTGVGFTLQFDSRDIGVNAYKGVFLDITYIHYGHFLSGETNFGAIEMDYRQYKQIGEKRRVIAWQIKSRNSFNNTPWTDLSQLGTPNDLRGYTWGRYRDKAMLFGIVEYRHMFGRKKPNKKGSLDSRFGFVTWVGTGSLGENITTYTNWLPNYGVGLRLETQKRMNVRVDYGRGLGTSAVYITFNEAF